ncbi:Ankyrin repeat-containing domain protein [Rhypophila decipiens]
MMDEFEWKKSFATSSYYSSSYGILSDSLPLPEGHEAPEQPQDNSAPGRGSFAFFVCQVTSLQRDLRLESPLLLNDSSKVQVTGRILGEGKTFVVRHAQWVPNPAEPPVDVALKEIISDVPVVEDAATSPPPSRSRRWLQGDWKDILFELRALLHEPLRYHPNVTRLLGIQWGLSTLSDSSYPILIMEYASFGTLNELQASSSGPLPFAVKQKLCYDVGRGLSALHACGIVHGDVKHENVLIFLNKDPVSELPYTAKLGDFGGSVMDMASEDLRQLETWTWPFQAPEVTSNQALTRSGMIATDIYSFGLLIWRTFLDGQGFVSLPGAAQSATDRDKRNLVAHKATEGFTHTCLADVQRYARKRAIPDAALDIIVYALLHTVRLRAADRDLAKAQLALRGVSPGHIRAVTDFIRAHYGEWKATKASLPPGTHGITLDSLALFLGRSGQDADLQQNLPGFRTDMDKPKVGEFVFDPETLKSILTWSQQVQMLNELKEAATKTEYGAESMLSSMGRTVASFFVFQCYLLEFGTEFNVDDAVHWLSEAASDDESHEDSDYFAQAWLCRISQSLGAQSNTTDERQLLLLRLSIMRGHRTALRDLSSLAAKSTGQEQQEYLQAYRQSRWFLHSNMGAVGMGYFLATHLTPPWDTTGLGDLAQLDLAIEQRLGSDGYTSSVRSSSGTALAENKSPFDGIFVNRRGHGLLHYAAARGEDAALRHMISKYRCDINLPNKHVDEPPLICACAGGKLGCALLLLDNGADPNGSWHGQEGGLHWLCSFAPGEMEIIAHRLITSGALLELRSGSMRHDVRGIRADWEHMFELPTTPLGRAVWMNSLEAVRVLLKLGAEPLAESATNHPEAFEPSRKVQVSSPFQLAAVLTLPAILAELISHIDGGTTATPKTKLLDESQMIDLAHGRTVAKFDPLSLQSRLVRCGADYKTHMRETLTLLHRRASLFTHPSNEAIRARRARVLCTEVSLGNLDIVECLLELGYDVNGTPGWRPLQKATELNHEPVFRLLLRAGADAKITLPTPFGHISLLHVCASRPRYARPGRAIADLLIAEGVPVPSADARSKPAIAVAILNQNLDVADALLQNGADVGAFYPTEVSTVNAGPESKMVNVLGEVLSRHTTRTLESLRFLFDKYKQATPLGRTTPPFFLDSANKLSALHWLAGSPHLYTHIAQITPKILKLCLDAYHEPTLVNYRHPILGTALYHAAAHGNKAMTEQLLQHRADTGPSAGPEYIEESVQSMIRPRDTWRPLWAAILRLDEELAKGRAMQLSGSSAQAGGEQVPSVNASWLQSGLVQNLGKTITLLSDMERDDDPVAAAAILKLGERKKVMLEDQDKAKMEAQWGGKGKVLAIEEKLQAKNGNQDSPVDLGGLAGNNETAEKKILELRAGRQEQWITPVLEILLADFDIGAE